MAPTRRRQRPRVPYTGVGLVFGAGLGIVIGALVGGWAVAAGIIIGAALGLVIGAAMDAQRRDRSS